MRAYRMRYTSARLWKWFSRKSRSALFSWCAMRQVALVLCLGVGLMSSAPGMSADWGDANLAPRIKKGERAALEQRLERGIRKLNPAVPESRAEQIARLLVELSPRPRVSVGILMQESAFRDVHTGHWGVDGKGRARFVFRDLGIAQINWETAIAYKCDLTKLVNHELKESIRCHSVVLRDKIGQCKTLASESFGCYHSKTPSLRHKYYRAVMRHIRHAGLEK